MADHEEQVAKLVERLKSIPEAERLIYITGCVDGAASLAKAVKGLIDDIVATYQELAERCK